MMKPKWSSFAKGVNYLALWTASTIYKKNDLVKYGGQLYICIVDTQVVMLKQV